VNSKAIYNSQEPAQMLANLEGISVGAAFILKDLHRHMGEPVVVRRLRDVGQKFSAVPPARPPTLAPDHR